MSVLLSHNRRMKRRRRRNQEHVGQKDGAPALGDHVNRRVSPQVQEYVGRERNRKSVGDGAPSCASLSLRD